MGRERGRSASLVGLEHVTLRPSVSSGRPGEGSPLSKPRAQANWPRPFYCPQNGGGRGKGSPGAPRL